METSKRDPYLTLVRGWSGLDYASQNSEESWVLLASTLRRVSENEAHARRIRDEWPLYNNQCPKPMDLAAFALTIPANPEQSRNLPEDCEKCHPFGGYYRVVIVNGYEGTKRCDCERGRILSKMYQARRKAEEAKIKRNGSKKPPAPPVSNVVQEPDPVDEGDREDLF